MKKKTDDDDIIKKIINLVRTAKGISNIVVLALDQQAIQKQVINKIKKILEFSKSHEAEILPRNASVILLILSNTAANIK